MWEKPRTGAAWIGRISVWGMRALSRFKTLIFERVSQIDGVNSVETSRIVEIIKGTWDYGTAWDDCAPMASGQKISTVNPSQAVA